MFFAPGLHFLTVFVVFVTGLLVELVMLRVVWMRPFIDFVKVNSVVHLELVPNVEVRVDVEWWCIVDVSKSSVILWSEVQWALAASSDLTIHPCRYSNTDKNKDHVKLQYRHWHRHQVRCSNTTICFVTEVRFLCG